MEPYRLINMLLDNKYFVQLCLCPDKKITRCQPEFLIQGDTEDSQISLLGKYGVASFCLSVKDLVSVPLLRLLYIL